MGESRPSGGRVARLRPWPSRVAVPAGRLSLLGWGWTWWTCVVDMCEVCICVCWVHVYIYLYICMHICALAHMCVGMYICKKKKCMYFYILMIQCCVLVFVNRCTQI